MTRCRAVIEFLKEGKLLVVSVGLATIYHLKDIIELLRSGWHDRLLTNS